MKKFLLLSLVLILASCGRNISKKPIEITYNNNGEIIKAHPSQTIIVGLEEDGSDGKGWNVEPYSGDVIGFISSRFIPDEKNEGEEGTRLIKFKALNYGTSKLKIVYYNRNRPGKGELKSFLITVNVVYEK